VTKSRIFGKKKKKKIKVRGEKKIFLPTKTRNKVLFGGKKKKKKKDFGKK